MARPIAVIIVVGVMAAFSTINDPAARLVVWTGDVDWLGIVKVVCAIVGGFVGLILVHESLHVAGHPGFGFTPETIVGIWPRRFVAYAYYGARFRAAGF